MTVSREEIANLIHEHVWCDIDGIKVDVGKAAAAILSLINQDKENTASARDEALELIGRLRRRKGTDAQSDKNGTWHYADVFDELRLEAANFIEVNIRALRSAPADTAGGGDQATYLDGYFAQQYAAGNRPTVTTPTVEVQRNGTAPTRLEPSPTPSPDGLEAAALAYLNEVSTSYNSPQRTWAQIPTSTRDRIIKHMRAAITAYLETEKGR